MILLVHPLRNLTRRNVVLNVRKRNGSQAKLASQYSILNPRDNENKGTSVNGFLWRATLNILSIAPLISTDALGGTIITDWYVNKNIKDQRIKITAYITTSELRSDGIRVKVHVQKLKNNIWSEILLDKNLAIQIENSILNEARNLRINAMK